HDALPICGDPPIAPQTSSNSAAAELSMAPPSSSGADSASVLQSILRNGALDQQALAQIDARAATRTPEALARAAEAESAAGHFEFDRNNLDAALQHAERSLVFAPDRVPLLILAAILPLTQE